MSGGDMGGSENVEELDYFTDEEYRILLSALSRERKLCEEVDEGFEHGIPLVPIVDSIERKIKAIQHKQKEQIERIRKNERKRPKNFDKLTEEYRLK